MVTLKQVEQQLKKAGSGFRFWGRPEIRELANILMQDEIIAGCVNGYYEGGFALLCVTNHRLLLVDRKPMLLTLEDIRFDMIAEIDYNARLLNNTVHIVTINRKLTFNSWSRVRLRQVLNYTQQRVMEVRQQYLMRQFQQQANAQVSAPFVGGLAMQGNAQQSVPVDTAPYQSVYNKVPLIMRRRRYPKFY